jgi:hypothetical protein
VDSCIVNLFTKIVIFTTYLLTARKWWMGSEKNLDNKQHNKLSTTQTGCTEALQLTSCQEGSGRVVLIRTGCCGIRSRREIHSHRLKQLIRANEAFKLTWVEFSANYARASAIARALAQHARDYFVTSAHLGDVSSSVLTILND